MYSEPSLLCISETIAVDPVEAVYTQIFFGVIGVIGTFGSQNNRLLFFYLQTSSL